MTSTSNGGIEKTNIAKNNSEQILGRPLKWSTVEKKLREAFNTESRFGSEKKAIKIGIGQGFICSVGRLFLDWTPANEQLPSTVIIKIPSLEGFSLLLEQMKESITEDSDGGKAAGFDWDEIKELMEKAMSEIHNAEVSFYELIASSKISLKVPQTYVRQLAGENDEDGYILMADQGEDSVVYSVSTNISVDDIMQVLDSLAEVQAYSLAHPECLKEIHSKPLSELLKVNDPRKSFLSTLEIARNIDKEKMGPLVDEIKEHFDESYDIKIIDELNEKFGMQHVLSHGDLWSANVIWKENGKHRQLAAIIDWQLAHPGTPSEDIARLMASSLSTNDRRQHMDTILERYYQKLTELLHHEPPFTFKQLKDSFIYIYPIAMFMIAPGLVALSQFQTTNNLDDDEEQKEQKICAAKQKTIGLFEDIVYYFNVNKQQQQDRCVVHQ